MKKAFIIILAVFVCQTAYAEEPAGLAIFSQTLSDYTISGDSTLTTRISFQSVNLSDPIIKRKEACFDGTLQDGSVCVASLPCVKTSLATEENPLAGFSLVCPLSRVQNETKEALVKDNTEIFWIESSMSISMGSLGSSTTVFDKSPEITIGSLVSSTSSCTPGTCTDGKICNATTGVCECPADGCATDTPPATDPAVDYDETTCGAGETYNSGTDRCESTRAPHDSFSSDSSNVSASTQDEEIPPDASGNPSNGGGGSAKKGWFCSLNRDSGDASLSAIGLLFLVLLVARFRNKTV